MSYNDSRIFSKSSGIRGRRADSRQFQTCLVIFLGIKGDDDTDANPTEGDD